MAKFPRYGAEAQRLFVQEGKSAEDIGRILSIRAATVRRWAKKYSWRAKQVLHRRSALSRLDKLYKIIDAKLNEMEELEPDQVTVSLISELTKLMDAANKMRRNYRPGELMVYAGEFFVPWLKQHCTDEEERKRIYHWFSRAAEDALKADER